MFSHVTEQPAEQQEEWRSYPSYEGYYAVSNAGRVKRDPPAKYGRKCVFIKMLTTATGYHRITLTKQGKSRNVLVHRMVLEAFVGPCPPGMEACHNNGIRSDNRVENLRWDTRQGNQAVRKKHGTDARGTGELNAHAKFTEPQVYEIRAITDAGAMTHLALANKHGVNETTISAIYRRKTWAHLPEKQVLLGEHSLV